MLKLFNFIGGMLIIMAFAWTLFWLVPVVYYADTGHYVDFGGNRHD